MTCSKQGYMSLEIVLCTKEDLVRVHGAQIVNKSEWCFLLMHYVLKREASSF